MTRYRIKLRSRFLTVHYSVDAPTDELAQKAADVLRVREDETHPLYPTEATVQRDRATIVVDPAGVVLERTSLTEDAFRRVEED